MEDFKQEGDLVSNSISNTLDTCYNTLVVKAKEYASDFDKLHNFKVAAKITNTTPEKALLGMMLKHWVSVLDIIENADKKVYGDTYTMEKIGDSINYLILLKAMLDERYSQLVNKGA